MLKFEEEQRADFINLDQIVKDSINKERLHKISEGLVTLADGEDQKALEKFLSENLNQ